MSACRCAGALAVLLWAGVAQAQQTYTYDALGRLVTVGRGATLTTYSYDANGNRTQKVVAVNGAPVAVADSVSTSMNTPVSFDPRTNDSDPNGNPLTITAATNGASGVVTITGGGAGLTYTPNAGFSGSDSFTYTISDGGLTATATVSVTVSSVDYTPDALNWADLSPRWNGVNGGSSQPNWVDGATLTISGLQPGASITLSFATDTVNAGLAGLLVDVYKNGVSVTRSMLIADAAGGTPSGTVGTVSVTNGDTIRFRGIVFDSAVNAGSGLVHTKSARQLVYNQTTGALLDTFTVSGWFRESGPGGPLD